MARRCMISYTDDDVTYSPFFGEPFSFPWRSVEAAEYSRDFQHRFVQEMPFFQMSLVFVFLEHF
jgi:hypothetical protein